MALAPPPALPPFKASSLDQQLTQSSPTSTAPWYNGYRLYLAALHRLTAELAFNYANQPLFRYHLEQAQTLNPNDPVTQALSQRSFPSNPLSPYQSH